MKIQYKILLACLGIILFGFLLPEEKHIPVSGATQADWNKETFWYEPWGTSGVHKGIDIFADKGTAVVASTHLLIVYRGHIKKGGNIVVGLGPKWRLHYFAHLNSIETEVGRYSKAGDVIATVGDSGNAKGKPAHLHFSLVSLLPYPWRIDSSTQGYKKAFFMNPIHYFSQPDRS